MPAHALLAPPTKTAAPAKPAAKTTARPVVATRTVARPTVAAPLAQRRLSPATAGKQPAPAPKTLATAAPNVVAATIEAALDWLPDSVRTKASTKAHAFEGYSLVTLLLGFDPFTHKKVSRTPEALLEALLKFSDEGTQLYQAVYKSGVLAQAGKLIRAAAHRYHLGPERVVTLLDDMLVIFHQKNLVALAFDPSPLLQPLSALGHDVRRFANAVGPPLLELILPVLGPRAQEVIKLLKKGQATFKQIMRDPKAFLNNLVDGVKLGFRQFADNAGKHLANSFMNWLLGSFKEDGVQVPKPLDIAGLFQLGLSLLGLTYDNLRAKLVKRMGKRGEAVMGALETAAGFIHTLVTKGPKALGQELLGMATAQLSKLKDQVFDGLRSWLQKALLKEGVKQLASLLTPATALLASLEKAYTTVVFFLERAERFQRLLTTIVDAFADIANRVLKPAADKVEGTLGQLLTLALDFFMRLIGLKDVPKEVKAQLTKARNWIDQTIDKYLDKFIEWAIKAFNTGKKAVNKAVDKVAGWLGLREKFALSNGEKHTLFFRGTAEQAQLMMASEEMLVLQYLDRRKAHVLEQNPPDKATQLQHIAAARLLAEHLQKHILTTTPQLHQDGPEVAAKVQELGIAMGLVGGLTDEADLPLPTTAIADYERVQSATMKSSDLTLISSSSASKTKGLGDQSPNGWALLKHAGFTRNTSPEIWVRMHLVSQKLSGEPKDANLVPAPSRQNTGEVLTFETLLKKLTGVGPGKKKSITRQPSVLWLHTTATFHDTAKEQEILAPYRGAIPDDAKQPYFARQVLFEAGIHYYVPNPDPAKAWVRDPTAYFSLTATISAPKLDPDHEWVPNLNDIGEEIIADRSNCSTRFARMVKRVQKEGNYKDNRDVKDRLLDVRYHPDHKNDVSNFDIDLELLMAALNDTQTIITDRSPTKGKKQRVKAPMGKLEAHDKKE